VVDINRKQSVAMLPYFEAGQVCKPVIGRQKKTTYDIYSAIYIHIWSGRRWNVIEAGCASNDI
jgi:hypothetical protein